MNQFTTLSEYGVVAFIAVLVNFLIGLVLAMVAAPRYRQHWLCSAPGFLAFAFGLEVWPLWVVFDLIVWWRSRNS